MPKPDALRKAPEHQTDTDERRARFRAALALARMTAEQWAEANGITPGHLSFVLSGDRESRSLIAKIEAFSNQQLGGRHAPASTPASQRAPR